MDQRVLPAVAATQLRQGIGLLLSRWSALQMAVDNEWGSRDSGQIAQQLTLDIFCLEPASPIRALPFYIAYDHKPPIYDDSCWIKEGHLGMTEGVGAFRLRVARHNLNPANIFLVLLVLKYSILQDEGPDVVTESVGVKMSLKHKDE
ncbi:hypothetical protein RJ639_031394 [Escallonia herrerae]|uniref:Uncharacterized protein n=1 Tax=Escallonia herrerae TaxID=1293975 RepID=A0AA88X1S2_9ASTE|nr:hypothetical protein RJ639_005684 [Escallonia herrerae]KAK3038298.1 hypothetical protein RJ639_031394 [Escallonia herrerae]